MKKIFVVLLIHLSLFVVSQSKKESVPLGKGETIQYFQDFGAHGFCIKTGTKSNNWKIKYYSNDLKLVWEKDLTKECLYQPAGYTFPIVGTPDGSIVYFIQNIHGETLRWTKTHLTQIKKDGSVKTIMLDTKKLVKKHFVVFCNEQKLFIVDTEDVRLDAFNKYSKMKWNMISVNHDDFKLEEKPINLPVLQDGHLVNSSWMFAGVSNNKLVLYANKFADGNANNPIVAKVDLQTNKVESQKLAIRLSNCFLGFSTNIAPKGGYMTTDAGDYSYVGDARTQTGNMFTKMKVGDNGNYYFYGSTRECGKKNYAGYFLQCFDTKGRLLWKKEEGHEMIDAKNKKMSADRSSANKLDLVFENDRVELAYLTRSYDETDHHAFFSFDSETGGGKKVTEGEYKRPKWLFDFDQRFNIDYSRNAQLQQKINGLKGVKGKQFNSYITNKGNVFIIYLNSKESKVEMLKY